MTKAKKKAEARPISQAQFARMLTVLVGHIRGLERERSTRIPGFAKYRIEKLEAGEELDEATALQIADALNKLRVIYDADARKHFPNKRAKARDLQDAVNAGWLVRLYGTDPMDAMRAVTGKSRLPAERDSTLKTLKQRLAKATDVSPQWDKVAAARKLLPAKKTAK